MINVLKNNKNFRIFWLASNITSVGDYIDDIAFAQLVYIITKSTFLMSLVFAIKLLFTFLSIFSSAIVDRRNKKRIIVTSSIGQGIVLLVLLAIFRIGLLNTYTVVFFVIIQSIFSAFFIPAQNAMIVHLVNDEEMVSARSALGVCSHFIEIMAYMFSGLLISTLGIEVAIFIDSITFFMSAIIMLRCGSVENNEETVETSYKIFAHDVKEGFGFVVKNRIFSQ